MLLRTYRNWLLISAIGLTAAVWGFGGPGAGASEQDGPQVTITPRPKVAPKEEVLPKSNIRSDVNLVLIPVTVTDPMNRFVTGLEKEYFKVFEDKKQQQITQFSSDDAPLSVGLLFDCSGSMGPKLKNSREAVSQFFKTANPDDEAFLVQFHDTADLIQAFTNNLEEIQNHLQFTQSKGMTALLDAIHQMGTALALEQRLPEPGALNDALQPPVAHGWGDALPVLPAGSRGRTVEESNGPGLLTELADQTGGRQYQVETLSELPDIAAKIGMELRNQYLLGYSPQNQERDGKYRHVEVKLVQPHGMPLLRDFWRMGYNAPAK